MPEQQLKPDNDKQTESDFRHRERIQVLWLKTEQLKARIGQKGGDKK